MVTTEKSSLPYAADVQIALSDSELQVLRSQYTAEESKGWVSTQTSFNLAWGLVKSESRSDIAEGIALLMEVFRNEATRRRECLYYLALGHYKLGNYPEAKRYNGHLLEKEPNNMQATSLEQLIDEGVAKEGYIGLGLVGGAAIVGSILLASVLRARR